MTTAGRVDTVGRRGRLAAALLAGLALAGCGLRSDVRDHLQDTYEVAQTSGQTVTYRSDLPIAGTAAAIAAAEAPIARAADGAAEYLRYEDDIVVVSGAARGSTVRVEGLDGYRRGQYAHLGPGFNPGSPAAGDEPGDAK